MSYAGRLGQVVKWPFLMAWSKDFFTGIKRVAWYHLDISAFVLAARALCAAGHYWIGGPVGLLVRLTCHIPDGDDLFPSSNVIQYLATLRQVAVKVAMQASSHSFTIDMRAPNCR